MQQHEASAFDASCSTSGHGYSTDCMMNDCNAAQMTDKTCPKPGPSWRFKKIVMIWVCAVLIFTMIDQAMGQPAAPGSPAPQPAAAQGGADLVTADGVVKDGRITLTVNKSAVVATKTPYKRVQVGNPEIADVNAIGPGNILLTAKKAGNTQLIVWDNEERSQVIEVSVLMDMASLQDQLRAMFPGTTIEVNQLNGAVALRGRVPSLEVAEQATAIASPYSPRVLNLMEVSGGQQVMLQVRFAEVSRTAISQLGVNGNYASGAFIGGSNIGQVNPSNRLPAEGLVGDTPPPSGITLDGATPVNPSVTLYGAGQIGNFYLEYFIAALRQNNLLRMLAEPNLTTMSGQEAEFLAGGEFPVPVTQGGGQGGVAVTVEYREFGVRLKFVPVVLGNGRIRMSVSPEVSDLDFTSAVRFNGFVIPGLTTRKVSTVVELADGQTFAIGGLLNNTVTAQKDVTPLLGDLPIVGVLFRSVRYQRKETELVVLVTPRLVDGLNPAQVPTLPGESWRHPTENDLFWNRDLGGEMPDKKRAPSTQPVAVSRNASDEENEAGPEHTPATGDEDVTVDADADVPRFRGSYGFVPATQPASAGAGGGSDD
jgi:pilus assembly protein CpaC